MKKNISKNYWFSLIKKKSFFNIRELIKEISNVQFRDNVELQQATKWLHENGKKSKSFFFVK
jgi:hypothetical protein